MACREVLVENLARKEEGRIVELEEECLEEAISRTGENNLRLKNETLLSCKKVDRRAQST